MLLMDVWMKPDHGGGGGPSFHSPTKPLHHVCLFIYFFLNKLLSPHCPGLSPAAVQEANAAWMFKQHTSASGLQHHLWFSQLGNPSRRGAAALNWFSAAIIIIHIFILEDHYTSTDSLTDLYSYLPLLPPLLISRHNPTPNRITSGQGCKDLLNKLILWQTTVGGLAG